jgi:membrane carboxypeptidase/penicillin-binding protein
VDGAAFYQLKTMMQGVLARGTARAISDLSPYVAGKTGTSDDENDAWFVGFTNEVTVAVWIGYDNAGNKRRTLGGGATGGGVAVPIFEPVIRAVWANVTPRTALAPPSAEAKRQLSCKTVDLESGEFQERGAKMITECFRVDRKGQIVDTRFKLETGENRQVVEDTARRKVPAPQRGYADPGQAAPQQQWGFFGGGQFGGAQYAPQPVAGQPVAGRSAARQPARQPVARQPSGGLFGLFGGWNSGN